MTQNSQLVEIQIDKLVYGGDAMGRLPDGRAVFMPFGLPGETVRVEILEEKRGHARGMIREWVSVSRHRIDARCKHYGVCGGCQYQHLSYARQLEIKREVVREQLERIAGINNPIVRGVVASPQQWNYRNSVQFHLSEDGKLGYLAAGTHQVVPIEECYLPEPMVDQVWKQLEFDPESGLERIEVNQGSDDEVLINLHSSSLEMPEMEMDLPVSAAHLSPAGTVVLAGDDALWLDVLEKTFKVSAGSFFQVNLGVAEKMVEHVLGLLPEKQLQSVLDLYCGVGLFSAFLASRADHVTGVELSESACEDFAYNLQEFENVSLYIGAAEDVLPGLKEKFDLVIADPPRAGLQREALDALVKLAPKHLIYVSCDPSTLARDLKRLIEQGYQLVQVTPFDMFPQTYHVETVVLMLRIGM
jgi:23S rRNA (uracil1939-C5)-methyltransferase